MERIECPFTTTLLYCLLAAIALGTVGCHVSPLRKLDQYGRPIKEIDVVYGPDGTKDFWQLSKTEDGRYYWIHIIDRPGKNDSYGAYGGGKNQREKPPRFLDELARGSAENIMRSFYNLPKKE